MILSKKENKRKVQKSVKKKLILAKSYLFLFNQKKTLKTESSTFSLLNLYSSRNYNLDITVLIIFCEPHKIIPVPIVAYSNKYY